MRPDMSRKVIERPRAGGKYVRKGKQPRSLEDLPFKQSMSRHRQFGWNAKQLTDKLSPLYRYLDSQLGRNWDTVQSEMLKVLDSRDPIQSHIFEHVDDHIAINVQSAPLEESETGLISHRTFGSGYGGWRRKVYPGELYVCPKTKIIRRAKSRVKRPIVKKESPVRKLTDDLFAIKMRGIWYAVDIVPYKIEREWRWYIKDSRGELVVPMSSNIGNYRYGSYHTVYIIDGRRHAYLPNYMLNEEENNTKPIWQRMRNTFESAWSAERFFGRAGVIGTKRRQMNAKELRAHNLKND